MVRWDIAPHNKYEHWFDTETQEHIIKIPFKTPTKVKLHELGHAVLDHRGRVPGDRYKDIAIKETDAELYAYTHMGRTPNLNLVVPMLKNFVFSEGIIRPSELLEYSMSAFKRAGMTITAEEKSNVWNYIKELVKLKKETG